MISRSILMREFSWRDPPSRGAPSVASEGIPHSSETQQVVGAIHHLLPVAIPDNCSQSARTTHAGLIEAGWWGKAQGPV